MHVANMGATEGRLHPVISDAISYLDYLHRFNPWYLVNTAGLNETSLKGAAVLRIL